MLGVTDDRQRPGHLRAHTCPLVPGQLGDRLARTRDIVPGHDPYVMQEYPAPKPALEGIAVRLDVAPIAPPITIPGLPVH